MEIMKTYGKGTRGIIHCFSYSKEMALEYVKMGFYIGIGGVVTFKNGKEIKRCRNRNSVGADRAGDRLPVYGTGAVPGQTENDSRNIHYVAGRSHSSKGYLRKQ